MKKASALPKEAGFRDALRCISAGSQSGLLLHRETIELFVGFSAILIFGLVLVFAQQQQS
jgi:hypothetical protein